MKKISKFKINKLSNILFLLIIFILVLSTQNCGNSNKPFVKVNGSKYTESDLKKEMPQYYTQIKNEFDEQLKRALERLGEKKLFDVAAKDNKFANGDEYINSLNAKANNPTEEDIQKSYTAFQKNGQLKNQTLEQVRPQIVNYLKSISSRDIVQNETSILKKKYGFIVGPEDARKEIKIAGKPTWHPNGKVTVVEFSGYDCPFCKRVQATTKELKSKYGDKVKWVFKDYPLNPNDIHHHISLNCVFDQSPEKFFTLFDNLYTAPNTREFVEKANLDKEISKMKIDMAKYDVCTKSVAIKDRIMADYNEGQSVGVRGIPHFFINGKALSGAQPIEAFTKLIEEEL